MSHSKAFTAVNPASLSLAGHGSGNTGHNNPNAAIQQKNRFTTENISYPLNVEGDSMQGHYIMFMVNEANSATLHAEKIGMTSTGVADRIRQQAQAEAIGEGGEALSDTVETRQLEHFRPQDQLKGRGKEMHSLALKKHATTRLDKAISLYMPPSVSVSYGVNYADKEVGVIAETAGAIISKMLAIKDISFEAITTTMGEMGGAAAKGIWQEAKIASIKALDMVAPGAQTMIALGRGTILTPRMELMMEGVSRRSFNYTFIFIPKSAKEARVVEDIIYAFKFHMHPEYFDAKIFGKSMGVGREMTIPSTFDIAYMYQHGRNSFLNKISTCFLKSMDVQYGAERFTAYETTKGIFGTGPPPQRTQVTLNFGELEIITKERIQEGY